MDSSYHPHKSNNKAAEPQIDEEAGRSTAARPPLPLTGLRFGRKRRAAESWSPTAANKAAKKSDLGSFCSPGGGPRPPLPSPGNRSERLCWGKRSQRVPAVPAVPAGPSGQPWSTAQPSMIKLTQQQEFELPLRVPLVALQLPLDLLVDPYLLRLFAGQAALHARPRWLTGKMRSGGVGACSSPVLCLHSSSCGIQLRCIPVACRRRAEGQSLITGARSRLQLAGNPSGVKRSRR